jgi:putative hemolysin
LEIFIILFLVLLNGVFSMSEIALISSRKTRLESEAKAGSKRAQQALDLANNPNHFLSTVQIGITLIGLLTGMYSGEKMTAILQNYLEQYAFLQKHANSVATGLVLIFITYLSLVLGELVPKRIGMSNAEGISKMVAGPMKVVSAITKPFIVLLSWSSDLIIKLIGLKPSNSTVTEEEVKSLISEGTSGGVFEEIEKEIVTNVFHLGDRKIASLMTPRQEVVWLDASKPFESIRKTILETKYSVYPLCKDSLDNVIGLIYTKDLIDTRMEQGRVDTLTSLVKEPVYLPESNRAYQALEQFRENKVHFGIIIDEYGSVIGVATVYDIVYALLGDISDEEEEKEIVERADGSFLIDGQLPFDEFLTHFEIKLTETEKKELVGFNTLGGFILHVLEDIPETGEKIDWKDYELEVVDMDKSRIDKILMTPILTDEADD